MATAFLFRGDEVLLMRKANSRIADRPFWSGLGGHVEAVELNHPRSACLREIYEESGFAESELSELRLRYLLLRIKGDEIRQQFVYFGTTARSDFVNSEEGELHWVRRAEVLGLPMSAIVRAMLAYDFERADSSGIRVGTITSGKDGAPLMQWAELNDPLVF
ncbi:MAG: NUDIX domain-containing protein [Paenibacillaceae bacterium]|nr:NUDIX domain-containing protein [Paenibacillaceae bacterium]